VFWTIPFKVQSRISTGWVFLLKPTPELWTLALDHRTQIVQGSDAALVVLRLHLKPGMVVIESGTGSGAMSYAIMRAIAPTGHLHTFEFNEHRAKQAEEEFKKNRVGHLVTVRHRDVCAEGAEGGFGDHLNGKVDAVFLDLPAPWLALPRAHAALKAGETLCSYSPCIEQVIKTCDKLRELGFHSITTVENRLRSYDVRPVEFETPDFGDDDPTPKTKMEEDIEFGNEREIKNAEKESSITSNGDENMKVDGKETKEQQQQEEDRQQDSGGDGTKKNDEENGKNKASGDVTTSGEDDKTQEKKKRSRDPSKHQNRPKKTILTGKLFSQMRGHTAFLTFAVKS